jgi:hypothetical protein
MIPAHLRMRAYDVGFGDCILLTFTYPDGSARHVLVDFGSTKLRTPARTLKKIADRIAQDTGNRLDMVVATHRHADHISGFAGPSGKVIAGLAPVVVVQPWTEDPALASDALVPVAGPASGGTPLAAVAVARLEDMHAFAEAAVAEMVLRGTRTGEGAQLRAATQFLGEVNIKNPEAVAALQAMGERHVYAKHGDVLDLGDVLPGVRVDVLGPPTLEQVGELANMASVDPDQFWHVATATLPSAADGRPFPDAAEATDPGQEARWLRPRIDRLSTEEVLSIVRSIDGALNNTSLILLLTVGSTKVLLPGDAQLEDWRWALETSPTAAQTRADLADCRVYKVGHHGSLNATPKEWLWAAFDTANRPADRKLITVLSTMGGKHGKKERNTEVPRRTLVEALEGTTDLHNTEKATSTQFWVDAVLDL